MAVWFHDGKKGDPNWLQEIFLLEKSGEDLGRYTLGCGPPEPDPEEEADDDERGE